ncbi:phosphotransferase enzyme family protein [Cellulomonas fengjieae]|uniref:Phosphotransferase n=1 Tax=Cellulomonas fengjieae TaxID=2819978 RepID=A0ABS3SKR9_9CELL|nr:phosphotransferase [Cellulomonas fengjieae]MBO3085954.1 phosphotransferase [Cellulomonas fengjieae]QVI65974.1 phosphotransferase [Cellulomonas fengjieae]
MDLAEHVATVLGVDRVEELSGGHQSRVFRVVDRSGRPAVAKVLDASAVDRAELEVRLDVMAALADLDPRVCRPRVIGERRIAEVSSAGGAHYVVCYEFADGRTLDAASPADAALMGSALAQLHRSMARLPAAPLPVVHALRGMPSDATAGAHQLLHGDFGTANLRAQDGVVRIFDLDDCGYGPPEFDVANALYMVLFDATLHGRPETYSTFCRHFVDGYRSGGPRLSEGAVDRFVDLRVGTLGSWLDDLDAAPVGVRTSSPEWQATLRSFVSGYRPHGRRVR